MLLWMGKRLHRSKGPGQKIAEPSNKSFRSHAAMSHSQKVRVPQNAAVHHYRAYLPIL